MAERTLDTSEALEILKETPVFIAATVAGLRSDHLVAKPSLDAWSLNEVLAHLRSCADVWGSALTTILDLDGTTFKAVNPLAWIKGTTYPEDDFGESLDAYSTQRTELLQKMDTYEASAWLHRAVVTGAGAPLTRGVDYYLSRMALHERAHWRQIRDLAETKER